MNMLNEKTYDLKSDTKTIEDEFNADWDVPARRLDMCDGRKLLSDVRIWMQDGYKISFSDDELIEALPSIPQDITNLINQLCKPEELKISR